MNSICQKNKITVYINVTDIFSIFVSLVKNQSENKEVYNNRNGPIIRIIPINAINNGTIASQGKIE